MRDQLRDTGLFIGEYRPGGDGDHAHQYAAAKCLKCGLCLEVCPNYVTGKTFFGAAFANDCYLVAARNPGKAKEIADHYAAHFGSACSKSLSCAAVCPMQIPTLASIAKMNRKR
jgi:succinate dehydrogenase / fumarate reductase iron-sulfur subunit